MVSDAREVDKAILKNALKTWRTYPMLYVDTVLLARMGVTLEKNQRMVLHEMFRLKRLLIPTHHAFGKSFLCAIFLITILNLYADSCVITTTAPTHRQVADILWVEMRNIFDRAYGPPAVSGKMNLLRYELSAKAFAVGISPAKPGKGGETKQNIQGKHARVVVVIGDEAGGIDEQIFDDAESLKSAGKIIYSIWIGNPLSSTKRFGQMCLTEKGEGYTVIHMTAYQSPNMIANGFTGLSAIRKEAKKLKDLPKEQRLEFYGDKHYKKPFPFLLSPGWVMECYMKWGESPLFFSRCIGEWSTVSEDCLVPLPRMNELMLGTHIEPDGSRVWDSELNSYARWNGIKRLCTGIDCSGEGKDKVIITTLEGNRQFHFKKFAKTWEKNDVDYRGTKMKEDGPFIAAYIWETLIKPYPTRKHNILIDCTGGYGDTIYSALMKYPVQGKFVKIMRVTFGVPADDDELYHDNIAEMAFTLADDLISEDGILLEENEDLKNQITMRKKLEDGKNRNTLEGKKAYKVRAGQSPDEFDSLMLANKGRHLTEKNAEFSQALINTNKLMEENKPRRARNSDDDKEQY